MKAHKRLMQSLRDIADARGQESRARWNKTLGSSYAGFRPSPLKRLRARLRRLDCKASAALTPRQIRRVYQLNRAIARAEAAS